MEICLDGKLMENNSARILKYHTKDDKLTTPLERISILIFRVARYCSVQRRTPEVMKECKAGQWNYRP